MYLVVAKRFSITLFFLDPELEERQRRRQSVVVILIPYIDSTLILKLINDHSPEVISRFFIPWLFKHMLIDTALSINGDATKWGDSPGDRSDSFNGGGDSGENE